MKVPESKSLIFILLIISFLSCKKEEEPTVVTYADIENEFKNIELRPGTFDYSLKITNELDYNFRLLIPDMDLTKDIPLILNLHWAAPNDPDAHIETECYVKEGMKGVDAIILSPNGGSTTWGTQENQDKLRILMDLSTRLWPLDLSKIAVMGYSSGGNGTWLYCETQPQLFSAGIAMASGYNIITPTGEVRTVDVPMYVIHGQNDDLFPIDTVAHWVEQTQMAGSEIEFVVAPNLSHYQPCDYVPFLKEAATWLVDDIWQ